MANQVQHLALLKQGVYVWQEASLQEAYFKEVVFNKSDLTSASLQEAHLKGIVFRGANLTKANFERADLDRAVFRGTRACFQTLEGRSIWTQNLGFHG